MKENGTTDTDRIKINAPYSLDHDIPSSQIQQFQIDGFTTFPTVFSKETVMALNHELELVLRGTYDTNVAPDKYPKVVKQPMPTAENNYYYSLGYSGNDRSKVFQIINIHKSNTLFRELVLSPILGKLVAKLMQWDGARLAQDQIWAKPTGSKPLVYHRDSPYFMFDPDSVATVWIALDDMDEEKGPLTYVKGSHRWGNGRFGSAQYFFLEDGGESLLYSAAERAGVCIDDLEYVSMAGLLAGGLSIHDGRTWHGSGSNISQAPRRGIGLHFVPVDVKWTTAASKSSLWKSYVEDVISNGGYVSDIKINDEDFPVTWKPKYSDSIEQPINENVEQDLTIDWGDKCCGYSPFQECSQDNLNAGVMFKSMPTNGVASFDDDGSYDETKSHEEVFVVENLPQSDASMQHESCHDDETIDFNLIAEQALASLDADYNDTVQVDLDFSSQIQSSKPQPNNDLSETAFPIVDSLDFGAFKADSVTSLTSDMLSNFPKLNAVAVKSAMKNIHMNSAEAMNTKWRSWKPAHAEYSCFTVPESHEIIPSKSLATFRQHSATAKKIATSLSISATIADALQRFFQSKLSPSFIENDTLVFHCIVDSDVKYESNIIQEKVYGPVIKWLHHYEGNFLPSSFHVQIVLFGPEMPSQFEDKIYELPNLKSQGRLHSASITYKRTTYHDYIDKMQNDWATSKAIRPNMIMAFNPRFREKPGWHSTLVKMFSMQLSAIFVVTACTIHDAEKDDEILRSLVPDVTGKCLWSSEVNSFCSRAGQPTGFSCEPCYENGIWQAFILRQ